MIAFDLVTSHQLIHSSVTRSMVWSDMWLNTPKCSTSNIWHIAQLYIYIRINGSKTLEGDCIWLTDTAITHTNAYRLRHIHRHTHGHTVDQNQRLHVNLISILHFNYVWSSLACVFAAAPSPSLFPSQITTELTLHILIHGLTRFTYKVDTFKGMQSHICSETRYIILIRHSGIWIYQIDSWSINAT